MSSKLRFGTLTPHYVCVSSLPHIESHNSISLIFKQQDCVHAIKLNFLPFPSPSVRKLCSIAGPEYRTIQMFFQCLDIWFHRRCDSPAVSGINLHTVNSGLSLRGRRAVECTAVYSKKGVILVSYLCLCQDFWHSFLLLSV